MGYTILTCPVNGLLYWYRTPQHTAYVVGGNNRVGIADGRYACREEYVFTLVGSIAISTVEQFMDLVLGNEVADKHFHLTMDLDFTDVNITTIVNRDFTGIINGMGFALNNMTTNYAIFRNLNNATISNLTIRNIRFARGNQDPYWGAGGLSQTANNTVFDNISFFGVSVPTTSSISMLSQTATNVVANQILIQDVDASPGPQHQTILFHTVNSPATISNIQVRDSVFTGGETLAFINRVNGDQISIENVVFEDVIMRGHHGGMVVGLVGQNVTLTVNNVAFIRGNFRTTSANPQTDHARNIAFSNIHSDANVYASNIFAYNTEFSLARRDACCPVIGIWSMAQISLTTWNENAPGFAASHMWVFNNETGVMNLVDTPPIQVLVVMARIDILPELEDISLLDLFAIIDARARFERLSQIQQNLVPHATIERLEVLEARILELLTEQDEDLLAAHEVMILIDSLQPNNILFEQSFYGNPYVGAVIQARDAFDALNQSARAWVNNLDELLAAESRIAYLRDEDVVLAYDQIEGLPTNGTLSDYTGWVGFMAMVNRINNLSPGQIAHIPNYDYLMVRHAQVELLVVQRLINQINARSFGLNSPRDVFIAYNLLSEASQQLVTNRGYLYALNCATVEFVIELINTIPAVSDLTLSDRNMVEMIRVVYDIYLNNYQRFFVTNSSVLYDARERVNFLYRATPVIEKSSYFTFGSIDYDSILQTWSLFMSFIDSERQLIMNTFDIGNHIFMFRHFMVSYTRYLVYNLTCPISCDESYSKLELLLIMINNLQVLSPTYHSGFLNTVSFRWLSEMSLGGTQLQHMIPAMQLNIRINALIRQWNEKGVFSTHELFDVSEGIYHQYDNLHPVYALEANMLEFRIARAEAAIRGPLAGLTIVLEQWSSEELSRISGIIHEVPAGERWRISGIQYYYAASTHMSNLISIQPFIIRVRNGQFSQAQAEFNNLTVSQRNLIPITYYISFRLWVGFDL